MPNVVVNDIAWYCILKQLQLIPNEPLSEWLNSMAMTLIIIDDIDSKDIVFEQCKCVLMDNMLQLFHTRFIDIVLAWNGDTIYVQFNLLLQAVGFITININLLIA